MMTDASERSSRERILATPEQWAYIGAATRLLASAMGYGSLWRSAYPASPDPETDDETDGSIYVAHRTEKSLHERIDGLDLRRLKAWGVGGAIVIPSAAPNPAALAGAVFANITSKRFAILDAYAANKSAPPDGRAIANAQQISNESVGHAWARLISRPLPTDAVAALYGLSRDEFRTHVRTAEEFLVRELANASADLLGALGHYPQPDHAPTYAETVPALSKKQKEGYRRKARRLPAPAPCVTYGPDSHEAKESLRALSEPRPTVKDQLRWKIPVDRQTLFDKCASRGEALPVEEYIAPQDVRRDPERRPRETWRPLASKGQFHGERYGFSFAAPNVPKVDLVSRERIFFCANADGNEEIGDYANAA